jgi:hypothetical protein
MRREAVAAVAERSHADIIPDTPRAPDPVSVTMPLRLEAAERQKTTGTGGPILTLVSSAGSRSAWRTFGAGRVHICDPQINAIGQASGIGTFRINDSSAGPYSYLTRRNERARVPSPIFCLRRALART